MNVTKLPNKNLNDTLFIYTDGNIRAKSGNNIIKGGQKDSSFDIVKKLFQKAWNNSTNKIIEPDEGPHFEDWVEIRHK